MNTYIINRFRKRVKAFLISGLLLTTGIAQAQVLVEGNVFGGGNLGEVTGNTTVTINDGTIGKKIPLRERIVGDDGQITRIRYGNVYGGGDGYNITGYTGVNNDIPVFELNSGRVQGNTNVTIGGHAVVRHAVYGGGDIGAVGRCEISSEGLPLCHSEGKTTVIIKDNALIGPKKEDLTEPTEAEIQDFFGEYATYNAYYLQRYIDTAFKYLGADEGFVYGGSRGIAGEDPRLSFVDSTHVNISGNAQVVGSLLGGGENGHVATDTWVKVSGGVFGGIPLHGGVLQADGRLEYTVPDTIPNGQYNGVTFYLRPQDDELLEDEYGVGRTIYRGQVFGGGRGTDYISWLLPDNPMFSYTAGNVYGNSHVTVSDNALIYLNVYGGGPLASVGTFKFEDPSNPYAVTGIQSGGHAYVNIKGGQIGTDGLHDGDVYGGGFGFACPEGSQARDLAYVGHTHVTISGGRVTNSVYGGSANGHVQGDANVLVTDGTIGIRGQGGRSSNVFGGGGGTARYTQSNGQKHLSITSGRVFGDATVEIQGGTIYHNVYGGGSLASVGTYLKTPGRPYEGGGHVSVTITGGTIGYNGNENGMVFGSGRGDIDRPDAFMDSLTYVAYSTVNIGEDGAGLSEFPKIRGSVYGSGENGHVYLQSEINVYSGIIGCESYDPADPDPYFNYRGNVYGAGCGTDMYDSDGNGTDDTYNPNAGYVQGNATVNIYGGYISRNVYGGGAMASVGMYDHTKTDKHDQTTSEAALSWPYYLEFISIPDENGTLISTGQTNVNIYGGHIGTLANPMESGDVYGSARGDVGPLHHMDTLAIVREAHVTIDFDQPTDPITDETENCIIGSVYGSGENGAVYGDTYVTLTDGYVGGSVFGGGKGADKYRGTLYKLANNSAGYVVVNDTLIHSITAGKVYGSTDVVIEGGQINHNVYGGGNLASVGKGNYIGYGEMPSVSPTTPYENSGKAKVTINGGTIGTGSYINEYGNVNGFVYGSSKGFTYPNVRNPEGTTRYEFSRDFFLGYTNETEVVIGSSSKDDPAPQPHILGSVFGGGENGHVRWATDVTVNDGEIGVACTATEAHSTDPEWLYRGNVYGAGRGIDKIGTTDDYCNSAGSVTLNTEVTVNGGTIHHNVYGGGSMATVGPPPTGYNPGRSLNKVNVNGGTIGTVVNEGEDDEYLYGGNVFGAGRGNFDLLTTANIGSFATSDSTEVHLYTGADIFGNVYGGGEIGQTKKDTYVYIHGGIAEGSVFGAGKGELTDEKAALVLGNATVNMTGGSVERSIYGGGELGNVGTYTGYYNASEIVNTAHVLNEPKGCEENTGLATVLISGGNVGVNGSLMPVPGSNADDDDRGWVFCGGRGDADTIASPKANLMGIVGSTYLEISKTETTAPLITASVYGGCENGLVLGNTHVKIAGGQIGTGLVSKTTTPPTFDPMYTENTWNTAIAAVNGGNISAVNTAAAQFHECDAWPYGDGTGHYKIYDYFYGNHMDPDDDETPLYEPAGSATTGSNGHSFFGNVFGGGSGYYPIAPGKWRRSAGRVWGNTHVEITGGHILNSVYGGNETTDVMGKCFVEMSDGTVGVPRTSAQITANPVIGHLYGAGMGDPRQAFDAWNNVDSTRVEITGGVIFGSVFGGGENGHVLDSTKVIIAENALIGTTGLSGYDGLVFGGGKGDECNIDPYPEDLTTTPHTPSHANFAPGRVGGNTRLTMSGGKVLGNLYGGGFVARIGVGVDGGFEAFEFLVNEGEEDQYTAYSAEHHGLTKVEVSGGTIGNLANDQGFTMLRDAHKSGNVYGGGCGDPKEYIEDDLGRVANSVVNITDSPTICGSVFGGGQMANVGHWNSYNAWYTEGTSTSVVNITGTPTIGTPLEFKDSDIDYSHNPGDWTHYDTIRFVTYGETTNDTTYLRMLTHTRTGNVYGGGQGEVVLTAVDAHGKRHVVGVEQGHCGSTEVHIGTTGNPRIYGSVFGGSEQGAVWGGTEVHIAGGTIGTMDIVADSLDTTADAWVPSNNGYYYGSVFGGSYGKDFYNNFTVDNTILPRVIDSVNEFAGRVYGNTLVDITGGTIRGNVFGGGDMASVGYWSKQTSGGDLVDLVPATYPGLTMGPLAGKIKGNTTVNVTGSTTVIGPLDGTGLNAYVFGGGKGFSKDPNELRMTYANVDSTSVTISGGRIWGSVFGGGSDSHVLGSTSVAVHTGANIGTDGLSTWDGNVFGGGRDFQNNNHTNGRVAGNVNITMDGGTLQGSIFGGGRMALTGVDVNGRVDAYLTGQNYDSEHHGLVTINVSGEFDGTYSTKIGNSDGMELLKGSDESVGDIFGSGKGDTREYMDTLAGRVANTIINVTGSPRIYGSVFGGGEMASVGYWYRDNTNPSHPKSPFYGNTGSATVTIGSSGASASQSAHLLIGTDMEFWADYAYDDPANEDDGPSYWTVYGSDGKLIHTCTGNVYGGSQGDVDTLDCHWVSMARSRTATVTINSGTIMSRVFGGAEQGSVAGNTYVTVNGGTIGSWVNTDDDNEVPATLENNYLFGGVYGGGYGSHNPIFNGTHWASDENQAITNDSTTVLNAAYPGQNLWTADHLAGRVYGNTHVDVLGGTIQGDVFGGASYAYIGGYGNNPHGDVELYIGSAAQSETYDPTKGPTILGGVFGANDHSGTPFGDVEVHVYNTKHITSGSEANEVPDNPVGGWTHPLLETNTLTQKYALQEVYGGGNRANYTPNRNGRPTPKSASVHVYTCYNTIRELYGGGKAADVGTASTSGNTNTSLLVDGGRIYQVFGGGNGSLGTPPVPANTYGTAETTINGGVINEVYGGSNQFGYITNIDLDFNDPSQTSCAEYVDEVYGGNNDSPYIGDVVTNLWCGDEGGYEFYGGTHNADIYGNVTLNVYGGNTTYLFGGSKGTADNAANIKKFPGPIPSPLPDPQEYPLEYMIYSYMVANEIEPGSGGNITVNLYGGTHANVFGGCNINGTAEGTITVNVIDEEGDCPLDLTNVYGGSNQANYQPTIDETVSSPVVNVVHIQEKTSTNPYIPGIRGNVYGGSYGHKEAGEDYQSNMTANPVVNIGYNAATMSRYLPEGYINWLNTHPRHVLVCGNVYGGGDEGIIDGSTTVNVYDGTIGTIEYTKSNESGPYDGINHLTGGNVFGASKGCTNNPDHGRVKGNSNVSISGGIVYNNVYGGGEVGSVGEREAILGTGENPPIIDYKPKANGKATVTITGGQVGPAPITGEGYNIPVAVSGSDGMVFGGCKGESDDYYLKYKEYSDANETEVVIQIPSEADITTNRIWGSVFGGGEDGHVLGNTKVRFLSGTVGTSGTAEYDGNVFGGGRNYLGYNNFHDEDRKVAGRVRGNATIEMSNGHIMGNIYGGGSRGSTGFDLNGNMLADVAPNTFGHTTVAISGGEIGTAVDSEHIGNVFGGGMGKYIDDVWGTQIMGFENLGRVKQTQVNISDDAVIHGSVYGGGEIALVNETTEVHIDGGTIGGASGTYGVVGYYQYGSVYGGGKGFLGLTNSESWPKCGEVGVSTEVNMTDGQVYENVFGGGEIASVGNYVYRELYTGDDPFEIVSYTGGTTTVNITGGTVGPLDMTGLNGYVYGGSQGYPEDYTSYFKAYANVVNTEVNVAQDEGKTTRIYGSIFGGSADGHVLGDVSVTLSGGTIGTDGTTSWDGNIFGGGRNFSRANYTAGRVGGNITVEMTGGHLLGSLFGGGRNAGTGVNFNGMVQMGTNAFQALESGTSHGNVKVKVCGGEIGNESLIETFTSSTMGDVFGGGKGTMEGIVGHPVASALLVSIVKNTEVIITDSIYDDGTHTSPKIYGNVYGGGEVANVGNYTWGVDPSTNIVNIDVNDADGEKGLAKVTINGGRIGVDRMLMHSDLVGGDGSNKYDFVYNSVGNVYGGGEGMGGDPASYVGGARVNTAQYGNKYLLDVMAAVGSTDVTICNKTDESDQLVSRPWVKGSVYGGSPMGHVMTDTWVKIQGGQIGAGKGADEDLFYEEDDFVSPLDPAFSDADALDECDSWPYSSPYDPFDPLLVTAGTPPTDGKTWFGNVYGGGSGYVPYIVRNHDETADSLVWNRDSGKVYGDTRVDISGGHILSNVYGGCETSDVGVYRYNNEIHGEEIVSGGKATVTMSGGTIGVPRTVTQIQNRPLTGYLFGSGKGDPRMYFNTWTNVQEAEITITGGTIYRSVFGSGEEGHVLGDVTMTINEDDATTIIGTWGNSGYDGDVFGAGRGFTGIALTAGTVGGSVGMTIEDGNILGSVYGGGSLSSVGTYLVDAKVGAADNEYYGILQPDVIDPENHDNDKLHGHTTINISGGTIGNSRETPTHDDPITYGGNVFGGGMGRFIASTGPSDIPIWPSLARVKETNVTISDDAIIRNSVFGGGEIGTVRDNTTVNIEGGTIGGIYGEHNYCGHVFGGGKGYEDPVYGTNAVNDSLKPAIYLAGRVYGNTTINISAGQIYENVYGGGMISSVGWVKDGTLKNGHCAITMTGGKIGPLDYSGVNAYIFGGPKGGSVAAMKPYCNVNSTEVKVDMDKNSVNSNNQVYGSLFGGGSQGHVLGDVSVTLTDGTIGTEGATGYDGNIFGAGRNYREISLTAGRVGGNVTVSMTGGELMGNIFGGGRQGLAGVDENGDAVDDDDHGNISITVSGGTIGTTTASAYRGHVFGGGKGQPSSETTPIDHTRFGEVRSTDVNIQGTATVYGSVFGGSENGIVLKDATVTIAGTSTIGVENSTDFLQGNVFGGGRGSDGDINPDHLDEDVISAGRVLGQTRVNVNGGTVMRDVFGGGEKGIVEQERIVNINDGEVQGDVFGGSYVTMSPIDEDHGKLKILNIRGGHILGNAYGSSYDAREGVAPSFDANTWESGKTYWSSFVNITGGTIDKDVYGAGYGGTVYGSNCINIGLTAIKKAPTYNTYENAGSGNPNLLFYQDGLTGDPTPAKIKILGNVFGGSDHFGSGTDPQWNTYDIAGYSYTFIDGEGYNMDADTTGKTYMYIYGGVYGCGTLCESGKKGREILIRNYGERTLIGGTGDDKNDMSDATRTMTTIQRGGYVVLDNANIHMSGAADISNRYPTRKFGVLQVDNGLYLADSSSFVLGIGGASASMDSIRELRSVCMKGGVSGTTYDHLDPSNSTYWELVGIANSDNKLYRSDAGTALASYQENVIIFNGDSRLWVRYKEKKAGDTELKQYYGALMGFFRMRSHFTPEGTETFAKARPKLTANNNHITGYDTSTGNTWNKGDGGFLSYNSSYNNFITTPLAVLGFNYPPESNGNDGGAEYTCTRQYPYYNVSEISKTDTNLDTEEYRAWVLPKISGTYWYVDGRGIGTGGWGKDETHENKWGEFPDLPKKTISGDNGICNDVASSTNRGPFNHTTDVIFVVGPVNALVEGENLNKWPDTPLRVYRYPGGHAMSNGVSDAGGGDAPTDLAYAGLGEDVEEGPGANLGMMIHASDNSNLVMDNVILNGLYNPTMEERTQLSIPSTYYSGVTDMLKVNEPLVVAESGATLTMKGGTTLTKGYNKTDGALWYSNPDYTPTGNVHHGGALYVAPDAITTVKVEGSVTITYNWQKKGTGTITSNVYLPTFDKSLTLSDYLDADTRIGVTSPKRNNATSYRDNTFSPIAVANKNVESNNDIANAAWTNENFIDEQGWFFYSGNKSTYYNSASGKKSVDKKTLYFGWTWANVVRSKPAGYTVSSSKKEVTVSSEEGLAWLISKTTSMNDQAVSNFNDTTILQTADFDLKQYVWVPVGSEEEAFQGTYDGQGHTIKNLYIDYIGTGDIRYDLTNYGLFGNLHNGKINRTFLVSGDINPLVTSLNGTMGKNIGGLVGFMDGNSVISNSEAAVTIEAPNLDATVTGNVLGGMVAVMQGGEIHSSMAMSSLSMGANYRGTAGGLVGNSTGGNINNSFVNGEFYIHESNGVKAGGLLGINTNAKMKNCYVTWVSRNNSLSATNFGRLAASNATTNNIEKCYVMKNTTVNFNYAIEGNGVNSNCKPYLPVFSSDNLGYMYADNSIEGDTAMFMRLNEWADRSNADISDHKYARWARPGISEINGDMPVLLLGEFDGNKEHQGGFRSLSSIARSKALQYGGPVRDTIIGESLDDWSPQLDGALTRTTPESSMFIYGDVMYAPTIAVSADKVSVYEHASILHPGSLTTKRKTPSGKEGEPETEPYTDTYVGISFDNSKGSAQATFGMNYGLGGGSSALSRDWHMFSTPLSNAPQGFNYQGHNTDTYVDGTNYSYDYHYNNPWVTQATEFSWLNGGHGGNIRYWMKGWDNSQGPGTPSDSYTGSNWRDGYFPSNIADSTKFGETCISGTDEYGRYPYGMDFYTWTEPHNHWINFKRNGPNHWRSDLDHEHIDYAAYDGATENENEETLVPGRGYMGSIATPTFMQSHGILNEGGVTIPLTKSSTSRMPGWNLVGNPYHGYIDFHALASANTGVLDVTETKQYYVVYDADGYDGETPGSAFLYYPVGGSIGGEYADRYIHPHQGFYVKAKDGGGDMSFTEAMLVGRDNITSSFRDDWRPAYPLVNLYLSSDNGCNDVTVIEFDRPEWGGATKMRELRNGNGLFYGYHEGDRYAAMFTKVGTERVPLWFEAKEDDIFTMKWNIANGDFHSMYLIDNVLGFQYDMLANDTYTFEGHKQDYHSRFYIVFNVTDVEEINENNTFVFYDGSEWVVNGDGDLDFIDELGHVLWHGRVNGQSRVVLPKVAPSVYMFRLTNPKEVKIQKVTVMR